MRSQAVNISAIDAMRIGGTHVVVYISVVSRPVTVVTIVSMSVDTEVTVFTDVAVEVTTMVLVPLPDAELVPFLT